MSNRNKIHLARCYINLVVIGDGEKQEYYSYNITHMGMEKVKIKEPIFSFAKN
jgi:hypothetical protein